MLASLIPSDVVNFTVHLLFQEEQTHHSFLTTSPGSRVERSWIDSIALAGGLLSMGSQSRTRLKWLSSSSSREAAESTGGPDGWGGGGLVAKSCLTIATPWTVACQALLSMGFSRKEYWSGLPFPSPGDLPDPGIWTQLPCIAGRFFTYWAMREAPWMNGLS